MHLGDNDPSTGSKVFAVLRFPAPLANIKWRTVIIALTVGVSVILFLTISTSSRHRDHLLTDSTTYLHEHIDPLLNPNSEHRLPFQHTLHAHNYALTGAQCDSYFPGLFEEIDKSVEHRRSKPITKAELDDQEDEESNTRVLIYDGDMYIIADGGAQPEERTISILHGLHRAIIADPERHKMPNIEFIIGREDWVNPDKVQWGLTKQEDDLENWIIPDFGFWSWPTPSVGSYQSVRRKIEELEEGYPTFESKIAKLIWRGSLGVGSEIREALWNVSQGKSWSDVEELKWPPGGLPENLIYIEDHCKYQYVAQTEGNSYSGRQKYLHNCNSVIVSHELQWIQPWHKFMVDSGPEQNYVLVKKDFSDLDEKMKKYLADPELSAKIAQNNVKTFRDRYLTPAAQACYWRKLIYGYGEVSWRPDLYGEPLDLPNVTAPGVPERHDLDGMTRPGKPWRGTPWENYVVNGALDFRPARHYGYECYDEGGARRKLKEKLELEAELLKNKTEAALHGNSSIASALPEAIVLPDDDIAAELAKQLEPAEVSSEKETTPSS